MKIIYGIDKIQKFKKPVVALGVFDGVHLGHQRILKAAADKARRINGTSVVVTFWPDPHREKSLYSLEHRLRLIEAVGIDVCVVVRFTKAFSGMPAEDFVKGILSGKLAARYVYVGKNFRFGKLGRGDFRRLRSLSRAYNFTLRAFDMVKINGRPVSSTLIRKLITAGKINIARRLLARPVSVLGTVIKGDSLAARLGFPTANINPRHEILPPPGIYAAFVIYNAGRFEGVCYVGTRPTFAKKAQKRVEAHIFDFKKHIYGKDLEIQFMKKIRDDKRFASGESLSSQIKKDVSSAKEFFSSLSRRTIYRR